MKFIVVLTLLKISVLGQGLWGKPFPNHLSPALDHLPVSTMGLTLKARFAPASTNADPQAMLAFPHSLPEPVSSDFYSRNSGFFCRQEWKVEKAIAFPIRFRLGSVAEVDRLEGKYR